MEKHFNKLSRYGLMFILLLLVLTATVVAVGEYQIYQLKHINSEIINPDYPDCVIVEFSDTLVGYRGKVYDDGVWIMHSNDLADSLMTYFNIADLMAGCEECEVCKKNALVTQLRTITYDEWMSGKWETDLKIADQSELESVIIKAEAHKKLVQMVAENHSK